VSFFSFPSLFSFPFFCIVLFTPGFLTLCTMTDGRENL
jgi:hypothetical protein